MEKKYLKANRNHFKYFPLKPEIKELLLSKNFKNPTLVQGEALSILLQQGLIDVCVIIYSFNGSGKTLSFLIPVLNSINHLTPYQTYKSGAKVKQIELSQPQAIIILPTEALLDQTYNYLTQYSDFLEKTYGWKIKIGRIFKQTAEQGHILVGLAKKTAAHFSQSSHFISQLKWVVFDQCDQIKTSEAQSFNSLLSKFSQLSKANFILCSATGNNQGEDQTDDMTKIGFRRSIQQNLPNRNTVELDILKVLSNISLTGVFHFTMPAQHKDQFIIELLYKYSSKAVKNQIIIFFNTKAELRNFYDLLRHKQNKFHVNSQKSVENNLRIGYIHGDCGCNYEGHNHNEDCHFSKSDRINKLRNRDYDVMLATDIIGRGIDIRTVTLVFNYSEPEKKNKGISETNYIHRVGRTGRYTDTGVAVSFVKDNRLVQAVTAKHKVAFNQVKSIDQILAESQKCFELNKQQS